MNKKSPFLNNIVKSFLVSVLAVLSLDARRSHISKKPLKNVPILAIKDDQPNKTNQGAPIEETDQKIKQDVSLSATENNKKTENDAVKPTSGDGYITYHTGPAPMPEEIEMEKEPQQFKVNFSGYIKPEFFWDTRQTVGYRNDQLLVYPEPKELDRCGRDIQAHPAYAMCALETRLAVEIIGPDVLGAHAKGYVEGDFFGINDTTKNLFRMRHAYTILDWENVKLLMGKYWHPMYVVDCAPDTIEFNSGSPIDPFKRAPQIRITKRFKPFEVTFAALSEINFTNDGPLGGSCEYLRNAVIPDLSGNLQARRGTHVYGISVDFKRLVPRLKSDFNVKVEESIYSAAAAVYAAFNWESFALRLKATVAQNAADLSLLGGYAVHSIQPESDKRTYSSLECASIWADFNRANSKIEPGCFIGYIKNLGASRTIIPELKKDDRLQRTIYGFGTEVIDYVFRIQPRLRWFVKPVVFGLELDYTRASYGQPNVRGNIINRPSDLYPSDHTICPGATDNTRLLFTAFYYF